MLLRSDKSDKKPRPRLAVAIPQPQAVRRRKGGLRSSLEPIAKDTGKGTNEASISLKTHEWFSNGTKNEPKTNPKRTQFWAEKRRIKAQKAAILRSFEALTFRSATERVLSSQPEGRSNTIQRNKARMSMKTKDRRRKICIGGSRAALTPVRTEDAGIGGSGAQKSTEQSQNVYENKGSQ